MLYDYDMIVPFLCNVMCLFYAVLLMRSFLFHMQSVFLLLSYPVSHILCCMLYFVSLSVTHFACNFGLSVASVNALSCYLLSFSVLSLSVLFSACNPVFLSLSCSAGCVVTASVYGSGCLSVIVMSCIVIAVLCDDKVCVSVGNFFSILSRSFLPLCPSPTSVVHYNLYD